MESINTTTQPQQQNTSNEHNSGLNSAEIANLWSSYLISSIQSCIIKYLQKTVKDQEILNVLNYAFETAQNNHHRVVKIFQLENYPVPQGFTDDDVDLGSPQLFSDSFILNYIEELAKIRINGYSTALPMTARKDVLEFVNECYVSSAELYNKAVSLMLSRGIYIRPPYIEIPKKIDFVKKLNYLTGFLGDRRPLNAIEISHIFETIKLNTFRKALYIAFSQVAKTKEVREFMLRGKELSGKHIEIFSSIMIKNDLPITMSWDLGVTDSTSPPFSDKLMMQHIRAMNVVATAHYGKAFSAIMRKDLVTNFSHSMLEFSLYMEDGLNILIDNGWMEETPQTLDRDALAKIIKH